MNSYFLEADYKAYIHKEVITTGINDKLSLKKIVIFSYISFFHPYVIFPVSIKEQGYPFLSIQLSLLKSYPVI